MALIGIICDKKNENYLIKTLENNFNRNKKQNTVIVINEKSINNIQNVQFETILICDNNEEVISKKEIIKKLLINVKYLIINADIKINLELLNNMNLNVITYGFNSKSTVTASSVEEDVLICIQRKILNINNNMVDEQEIKVNTSKEKIKIEMLMAVATTMVIYEIDDIKT